MFVKRFVSPTLAQGMADVKRQLGVDAVILSANKVRAPGWRGVLGATVYEVVAAADETARKAPASRPLRTGPPSLPVAGSLQRQQSPTVRGPGRVWRAGTAQTATADGRKDGAESAQDFGQADPVVSAPVRSAAAPTGTPTTADLLRELQQVRELLGGVLTRGITVQGPDAKPWRDAITALAQTGLTPELLQDFVVEHVGPARRSGVSCADAVAAFAQKTLHSAGAIRTLGKADRVAVFIGPTGVGKTTTVAKLAARAAMDDDRRVGLLTLDTYRIGATTQLRIYADILDVPMLVAQTPREVSSALAHLASCDLILVDTIGRSFVEPEHVDELTRMLEPLPVDVTFLVQSAVARDAEAVRVAQLLSGVGFDALLFTKQDEALMPSVMLSMISQLRRPLSYISTGQRVPDDLEIADVLWLSSLFSSCAGGVTADA